MTDKCAAINDAIFAKYHLAQNEVFTEISEIAAEAVQKKRDKEKKLKLLVGEETDDNNLSKNALKSVDLELAATEEDMQNKLTEQ